MKILTAEQIRAWDAATLAAQGLTSLELMERAAVACVDWLAMQYGADTPFVVVCGTGNNGGDGLAIARLLNGKGYSVLPVIVMHTSGLSPDCAANLQALQRIDGVQVTTLHEGDFITELPAAVVLIDALFGTGLNRAVEGYAGEFIRGLNTLPNATISIDLPSGLPADGPMPEGVIVVQAQHTLTFQQYKRSMLHPESGVFCGAVHVVHIGLNEAFRSSAEGHWYTLDSDFVKRRYKPRAAFSHKGTHGTAFLIGGTHGLVGAVVLATQAAGRAGAGKVRALIPECGYTIIQMAAPEAMCRTSGQKFLEEISGWESARGIGVGTGLGTEPATVAAFEQLIQDIDRPIVLDADALNILGEHQELYHLLPNYSILTPHPAEIERLFGKTPNSFERAELVRQKAMEHELIIIAKDRYTIIALPDGRCYYNTYGNAGLATGGSGDVLCGIITGLLAQGYTPEDAAILGVYLHAAAGDATVIKTGMEAMVAGDIVAHIGAAFLTLA